MDHADDTRVSYMVKERDKSTDVTNVGVQMKQAMNIITTG